jgi:hypothetical protein
MPATALGDDAIDTTFQRGNMSVGSFLSPGEGKKLISHLVRPSDTMEGIALVYGITVCDTIPFPSFPVEK